MTKNYSYTKRRRPYRFALLAVVLALAACAGQQLDPPPPTTTPPAATTEPAPATATRPTVTDTPSVEPTVPPTPTPAQTATLTITPSPTADPYTELTIDALAARPYGGGLLEITDTLEENDLFTRYEIRYPSDGLDIYGFMNVPKEGDNFPVAIVLHGSIPFNQYEIVPYTQRYADALAEAGYFVIHPNLRNYPPSDTGPDYYRIGYAIDVLNLIAIIREQSRDPLGTLRRADTDNIHLWGHSMGGGVALRVLAVNNEPYLRAAVLYGSISGDEEKTYTRLRGGSNNRGQFELAAPPEILRAISPIHFLDRIEAAVAVHHSNDDDVVPVEWSEEVCAVLDGLFAAGEIPAGPECFFYDLQPHTFRGDGDALFMERVVEFFERN